MNTNIDNNIVDKIKKLLALAGNNPNEQEAQAALLKAQALLAKYNMTQADIDGKAEPSYFIATAEHVKANPRSKHLSLIIADSFAVRTYYTGRLIHFFGHTENAKAAASAMEFAHRVMEHNMNKECQRHGLKSSASAGASEIYNAYAQGFLKGLKAQLDSQSRALAIVVPQDVNEALARRFPNMKSKSVSLRAGRYQDSYDRGYVDGKHVMSQRELE